MYILKDNSTRFAHKAIRAAFRTWLTDNNPQWSDSTIRLYSSDAYHLYNNDRGITLEEALTSEDGLERARDVIERFYRANPDRSKDPSGLAKAYLKALKLLKAFITESNPELLNAENSSRMVNAYTSSNIELSVPTSVIDTIKKNHSLGFRFDKTSVNLLSSASGVDIDERMQSALKRMMFFKKDGIYFLFDTVTDAATRRDIIEFADNFLEEYGCFEISEFYKLYEDRLNRNCIKNAVDFEAFYLQIIKSNIRCVQAQRMGARIALYYNNSVDRTLKGVASKIVAMISDEYYGSCNEHDLQIKFCAFSTDLLSRIIKHHATNHLIRVEINDSVCYQTYDALGLPENFSKILASTLERLDAIGLDPKQEILHTALSLELGINFNAEYNLPDWATYRLLIQAFHKSKPHRNWDKNVFREVRA